MAAAAPCALAAMRGRFPTSVPARATGCSRNASDVQTVAVMDTPHASKGCAGGRRQSVAFALQVNIEADVSVAHDWLGTGIPG